MHKTLYTTNLTGTKMSQFGKVASQLEVGTELAIIPRPDNAYDNQAMSVHFGTGVTDPQVGWIPAKELEDKIVKSVLFNLTRHGIGLYATVVQVEPESKFLRVDVNMIEPGALDFADEDGDIPDTDDEDEDDRH